MKHSLATLSVLALCCTLSARASGILPDQPILFVTQVPVPDTGRTSSPNQSGSMAIATRDKIVQAKQLGCW